MSNTTEKDCKNCIHYAQAEEWSTCGTCAYPVPAWIAIRTSGGYFVTGPEGQHCATFNAEVS